MIGGEDGVEPLRPAVAPGPATKLLAIDVQDTGDGTLLLLRADGAVPSAESFVLKKPARLVIDLPGLTNHVPISRIDVGTAHAARVRLGQHPDKVRVVIDAGKASRPFDGRRLVYPHRSPGRDGRFFRRDVGSTDGHDHSARPFVRRDIRLVGKGD